MNRYLSRVIMARDRAGGRGVNIAWFTCRPWGGREGREKGDGNEGQG